MEDIDLADDRSEAASLIEDGWVGVTLGALNESLVLLNNIIDSSDAEVCDGRGPEHSGSGEGLPEQRNNSCADIVVETGLAELHAETEGTVEDRECDHHLKDDDEWVGFTSEELRDIGAWEDVREENGLAGTEPKIPDSLGSGERLEEDTTTTTLEVNARDAGSKQNSISGCGSTSVGAMGVQKLNFLMSLSKGTAAKIFSGRKILWGRKRRQSTDDDPSGELEEAISRDVNLGGCEERLRVVGESVMEEMKNRSQPSKENEDALHGQLGTTPSQAPPGDADDPKYEPDRLKMNHNTIDQVSAQGCARAFATTQKRKRTRRGRKGKRKGK